MENIDRVRTVPVITSEILPDKGILICTCNVRGMDGQEFKDAFQEIGQMVREHGIKKLIFDKRSLRVFHRDSMEWYHVHWKREMAKYGLRVYRKLLPDDDIFRMSVDIGKRKILVRHPSFKFADYDIRYCNSIEEAVDT